MNINILSIFIFSFLFILVLFSGCITTNENKTVKIGIITSLTGSTASWGESIEKAIELAKVEHPELSVEYIYEDEVCDPKMAVSAAQKLITTDNAKIIFGTVCSSATLAVAPITELNKVILMSVGSSSPKVTYAGDYVFRMWVSDSFEAKILAEYITKNMPNIKTISLIFINNDFGINLKDEFIKNAKELGLEIKTVESFELGAHDFSAQLTKIKNSNSDALYVISNPVEANEIFKEIYTLNLNMQLFAPGWVIEDKSVFDISKQYINGIIYPFSDNLESQDFKNKLSKQGALPENTLAAELAYDGINIIFDSIKECGENGECIKSYLYNVDYNGVIGNTSFDSFGDPKYRSFEIKKVVEGNILILSD